NWNTVELPNGFHLVDRVIPPRTRHAGHIFSGHEFVALPPPARLQFLRPDLQIPPRLRTWRRCLRLMWRRGYSATCRVGETRRLARCWRSTSSDWCSWLASGSRACRAFIRSKKMLRCDRSTAFAAAFSVRTGRFNCRIATSYGGYWPPAPFRGRSI